MKKVLYYIILSISLSLTLALNVNAQGYSGWSKENANWVFYVNDVKQVGWLKTNKKWYYLNDLGYMKMGWVQSNSKWYYLDGTGEMKTGWLRTGGKWYFLDDSGAMKTGWVQSGGKWYYLDSSGAMKTGWVQSGGKWYYLDGSGAMKTGWIKPGYKWYYLDSSGAMKTGWLYSGGKWYYLDGSGEMKTGWIQSGYKWYYLYSSGAMAKNTVVGSYKLGSDGSIVDSLYNSIYLALLNVESKLDVSTFTQSSNEAFKELHAVLEENPELFYFDSSMFWSNGIFEFKYQFSKSQIIKMNKELKQISTKIIQDNISSGMSDFEKVKAIHDYLVLNTAYDYESYLKNSVPLSSFNIYGTLIKGQAVCEGYAKTIKYLLDQVGIETLYVTGRGNGESHAWNKVKIEGKWYNLDATWDDPTPNQEGFVSYKYFLIPDSQLDNDHSWDDSNLPDANNSNYLFMGDMWDFSLVNGYYYYSNDADDIKIYRIKSNGIDKKKIADVRANELEVYGDWIYFSNYSNGGYLYKVKIDGSSLSQLTNFQVRNLQINRSILRYTDKDGSNYYSYQLN